MMDRTMCAPNFKGTGVHWDIVLLCAINCLGEKIYLFFREITIQFEKKIF